MTDPINLTQLRGHVERANRSETTYADVQAMWEQLGPPTVLALIDTAEAAQDYLRTNWSHNETPAVRRLRETLNQYTT
jgi:hypothetical protein